MTTREQLESYLAKLRDVVSSMTSEEREEVAAAIEEQQTEIDTSKAAFRRKLRAMKRHGHV
jgi:DNA-binding protein H-NS